MIGLRFFFFASLFSHAARGSRAHGRLRGRCKRKNAPPPARLREGGVGMVGPAGLEPATKRL